MLTVAHPDKVMFPAVPLTRRDVLEYYATVASPMLDHYRGRRLTVIRYPHGVDGPGFYQRHPQNEGEGDQDAIVLEDGMDILFWAARGVVEWHVPLGRAADPNRHDWAVVDLDPNPPADWTMVINVARVAFRLLHQLEIPFQVKTSGKEGLHLYIAVQPEPHQQITEAVRRLCVMVEASVPQWSTLVRRVADRGARVYLDYLQNGHTRTMAGVYSMRATPTGTVSTPVAEDEIDRPPNEWTPDRVMRELKRRAALWSDPAHRLALTRHLEVKGIL